MSPRTLSHGTSWSMASSGSPFAESAVSRLSASKNPSCPIVSLLESCRQGSRLARVRWACYFSRCPLVLPVCKRTRKLALTCLFRKHYPKNDLHYWPDGFLVPARWRDYCICSASSSGVGSGFIFCAAGGRYHQKKNGNVVRWT